MSRPPTIQKRRVAEGVEVNEIEPREHAAWMNSVADLIATNASGISSVQVSVTDLTGQVTTVSSRVTVVEEAIAAAGSAVQVAADLAAHAAAYIPHVNARVVIAASGTITVPTAVGVTGQVRVYDNTSGSDVTLNRTGAETIEGEVSQTLPNNCSVSLRSDGANWRVE